MRNVYLLLAALLVLVPQAYGLDSRLVSGNYKRIEYSDGVQDRGIHGMYLYRVRNELDYKDSVNFKITVSKNKIEIVDTKYNLTFPFDLGTSAEQAVPQSYLEYLKTVRDVAEFAKMIERLTISDLTPTGKGDEVLGRANLYFKPGKDSGFLRLKISAPIRIYTGKAEGNLYIFDSTTGGVDKPASAFGLFAESIGEMRVDSIETGVPAADGMARVLVQLIIDTGALGSFNNGVFFTKELEVSK